MNIQLEGVAVKGIVKYVDHKSRKVIKYMVSEDIEKDREEFEHRKHNSEDNRRSKYIIDWQIRCCYYLQIKLG